MCAQLAHVAEALAEELEAADASESEEEAEASRASFSRLLDVWNPTCVLKAFLLCQMHPCDLFRLVCWQCLQRFPLWQIKVSAGSWQNGSIEVIDSAFVESA